MSDISGDVIATCREEFEEGACGRPAEYTCDGCGMDLCDLCAYPCPQDQHACCACYEALPSLFPRPPVQEEEYVADCCVHGVACGGGCCGCLDEAEHRERTTGVRGASSATGERSIAALTGQLGTLEVTAHATGVTTSQEWTWVARPGAVILCRWTEEKDGEIIWRDRTLRADALKLRDGERVNVVFGKIRRTK